jgi:hypothetical protein
MAMGHVDDDGEVVDGAQSGAWDLVPASGVAIGFLGATLIFFLGCWVDFMLTPTPSRATATLQPAPVVAQPPTFAEMVKDQKDAMDATKAKARALDLLVVVHARPEMSADEVAAQATELANRLRCGLEVRFKGKTVRAWPGMSKESFVKQYVEQVEAEAGRLKP